MPRLKGSAFYKAHPQRYTALQATMMTRGEPAVGWALFPCYKRLQGHAECARQHHPAIQRRRDLLALSADRKA